MLLDRNIWTWRARKNLAIYLRLQGHCATPSGMGIAEIMMMAQQGQVRIYSPNGKMQNKLQKGLNIVVMQDGTTKKVVVK